MRMVRWMCGIKLKDIFSVGSFERLGIDDIILVLQQNSLRWYGHVLQKEDNDWVQNVWSISRGFQTKRMTKEDLERGCQRGLSSM